VTTPKGQTKSANSEGWVSITTLPCGAMNMSARNAGWTAERIELLRSLFASGFSSRAIALEIGVSRNAVIGKISRLKLNSSEGRRSVTKSEPKVRRSASQQSIMKALRADAHSSAKAVPVPNSRRCSLLELTNQTCRWPISNAADVECWFCGNESVEGLPYCAGHARIAYRSADRIVTPALPYSRQQSQPWPGG
jgi:GcrA cell cycle regulator